MKLIQKSLLFISLLTVGAASISTVTTTPAQAATCSTKRLTSSKVKIKVSKAQLYDSKGKKLSRCLSKGTIKKVSEKRRYKDCNYYKVGKDEYVKASNVTME